MSTSQPSLRAPRRLVASVAVAVGLGLLAASGSRAEPEAGRAAKGVAAVAAYEVVAGTGDLGDGRKARKLSLAGIGGLAVTERSLYFSELGRNVIRRVDLRSGRIETVVGDGSIHGPEGGRATGTGFLSPGPLAISPDGASLYFAQSLEGHLYRVDLATGRLTDLGGPPYELGQASSILVEDGEILVADALYGQVWSLRDGEWHGLIDPSQRIEGGVRSIVRDADGGLFISAFFSYQVLRWDPRSGRVEPYVGTGIAGQSPEGTLAREALIGTPDGIVLGEGGDLYFADMSNNRIGRVDRESGRLWTLHRSPEDGHPGSWSPSALVRDARGDLWLADILHNRVLSLARHGAKPRVVAGGGASGDRGVATRARLLHPGRIAVDERGDLFISEALHHRVRRVDAETGRITTVAGTGVPGYNGDGIAGPRAQLNHPGGLLAVGGRLYVGDYYNNRVRVVDLASGLITTLAGTGVAGETGDGGPAVKAELINPHALTLDAGGDLLVASAVTPTIRRIDLETGVIDSVPLDPRSVPPESVRIFYGIAAAGPGFFLADGMRNSVLYVEGGEVDDAVPLNQLDYPMDVAVSPSGDLYVCDTRNDRVVRWTGERLETVVEGLGRPRSLAFDRAGNLYVADTFNNRVLKLTGVTAAPASVAAVPAAALGGKR